MIRVSLGKVSPLKYEKSILLIELSRTTKEKVKETTKKTVDNKLMTLRT